MKTKMGLLTIALSIFYYFGIASIIYLFNIDDNTFRWIIAIIFILAGIIGSAVPEAMINVGVEGINVGLVRAIVVMKYIIFAVAYILLDKWWEYTLVATGVLCLICIVLEVVLCRQMFKTKMNVYGFLNMAENIDTAIIDANKKYLYINMIGLLLFLSVHETVIELIITLLLSCGVHVYTSEKVIRSISRLSKRKKIIARIVLWSVQFTTLVFSYFEYDILTYFFIGTYYMVATDWMIERKTSVIKL